MSSSSIQSFSKYHYCFNNQKTCAETETNIDFISSIWDDDQIMRLDEKNWQFLWCNTNFQGINDTEALDQVLGKKVMHIKIVQVPKEKLSYKKIPKDSAIKIGSEGFSS